MKYILIILLYFILMQSPAAFSAQATSFAQANNAAEPNVKGAGVIDLLKSGTLDAWTLPSDRWYVLDGNIVGSTGLEQIEVSEWIYSNQRFSDFEFTCELRLTGDERRNSGIYFRANPIQSEHNKIKYEAASGYEFDANHPKPGKNNFWGSLGDWYARPSLRIFADQSIITDLYTPEDWNRMTIRAQGNRFEYWLNGIKVMDFEDFDAEGSREGFISFQLHNGTVMKAEYRNIRVRPL